MGRRNDIDWEKIQKLSSGEATQFLLDVSSANHIDEDRNKKFNPQGSGPCFEYAIAEGEMRQQLAEHKMPYYVYVLCSPTGAAFYVGKGTGSRLFEHVAEFKRGKAKGNMAKRKAVRLCGDRIKYAIVASCADENMALAVEGELIRSWYSKVTNIKVPSLYDCANWLAFPSPKTEADHVAAAKRELARINHDLKVRIAKIDRELELLEKTRPIRVAYYTKIAKQMYPGVLENG